MKAISILVAAYATVVLSLIGNTKYNEHRIKTRQKCIDAAEKFHKVVNLKKTIQ